MGILSALALNCGLMLPCYHSSYHASGAGYVLDCPLERTWILSVVELNGDLSWNVGDGADDDGVDATYDSLVGNDVGNDGAYVGGPVGV